MMVKLLEQILENILFHSRWLMAPMYGGLVAVLGLLLIKFVQEFFHIFSAILTISEQETVLAILSLVDITLVGNLLLMVIFSGYENFVSKINVGDHEDKPSWMGKVDYSGLKLKLIASIVAISAIDLLKAFVHTADTKTAVMSNSQLAWMVGIHVTLVVTGLLFALMDRLTDNHH